MSVRRFPLPPLALRVRQALPPDRPVWLVGGAVRDLALGRAVKDLDLAVESEALPLGQRLAERLGGAFVPLDPDRGCARVVVPGEQLEIDLADFRAPGLRADLLARDFTLNAMAIDLAGDGTVIDPTGGLIDLDNRTVRLIHRDALVDDPLRGLRGVRIAAELGFALDPATEREIRCQAPSLEESAAERRREELLRCFAAPQVAATLEQLASLGLLTYLLPELETLRHHDPDRFSHSLAVTTALDTAVTTLEGAPSARDLPLLSYLRARRGAGPSRHTLLRLAASLHDVAKAEPLRVEGEEHAEAGARVAEERLRTLRLAAQDAQAVATLVRHHTRPPEMRQAQPLTVQFLYRFLRSTGDEATGCGLLMLADLAAKAPDSSALDQLLARVGELAAAHLLTPPERFAPTPLVNGNDLIAADICPPGPDMGPLLDRLLEAQVVGDVATRDDALALASRLRGGS